MLSTEQLLAFGRNGYLTVPSVVGAIVQAKALARIGELLDADPPAQGHTGHHFFWREMASEPELAGLLTGTGAHGVIAQLVAPHAFKVNAQVQVALTFPPYDHMPGAGHLDGLTPGEPSGRPGTFTLLAGVVLSDQSRDFHGNLVVWPGRHHQVAEHLRTVGADSIFAEGGIQPVDYTGPVQVHAKPGDLVLATYLLPHNIGGNLSNVLRRTVYFRITVAGHEQRWRDCVTNPLLEFPAAQEALASQPAAAEL